MAKLPSLPRKAIAGSACIYIAGLGWIAELFIPFSDLPNKGVIFVAILIAAEVSFLIGVALLGKAYYKELKSRYLKFLRNGFRKPPSS